jgi:hypothetical protein
VVLAVCLARAGAADETTWCNSFVDSLPYTITAQGHYCLRKNLSTAITTGAAVDIQSDFVTLDLNGFKIGGGAAGLDTATVGVTSTDRKNVIVRNGNIRGFRIAVSLGDVAGASQGNIVENIQADENTLGGILVAGRGNLVKGCRIVSTGNATIDTTSGRATYGIVAVGDLNEIVDNSVQETIPTALTGDGSAHGIWVEGGLGTSIRDNRVGNAVTGTDSYGIHVGTAALGVQVTGNVIFFQEFGIFYEGGSTGTYRNNLLRATVTSYTGGTDGLLNYP